MTCFETAGKRNSRHHRDQALKNTTIEAAVLWLKCCTRCDGDLHENRDIYGWYVACL